MSDYMMMPGARLEIGPGGKPYETLGSTPGVQRACCAPCGAGLSKCKALGDTASPFGINPLWLGAAAVAGYMLWSRANRRARSRSRSSVIRTIKAHARSRR